MNDIAQQIDSIREEWGSRLLILGHHYQRSSVVAHADETGDSLELARKASELRSAERIVFCGVHFMAESADMLSAAEQTVYMPETGAGCPMADMADAPDMAAAMDVLIPKVGEIIGGSQREERLDVLERRIEEKGMVYFLDTDSKKGIYLRKELGDLWRNGEMKNAQRIKTILKVEFNVELRTPQEEKKNCLDLSQVLGDSW